MPCDGKHCAGARGRNPKPHSKRRCNVRRHTCPSCLARLLRPVAHVCLAKANRNELAAQRAQASQPCDGRCSTTPATSLGCETNAIGTPNTTFAKRTTHSTQHLVPTIQTLAIALTASVATSDTFPVKDAPEPFGELLQFSMSALSRSLRNLHATEQGRRDDG